MAVQRPKDLFILEGISHLCFNSDFTQCALSKKDNKVYIYQVKSLEKPQEWVLLHTLKNHFLYVSGLDWCPVTNRIVTCSYDKTCMIWDFIKDKWTPSNLTASTKLGYLFVHWNKRGDKLVTGTSEKKLFMGYFNKKADWWAGRNIKGHKSSVVCARFDPSSLYIISGSTDMKVMVTSCYEPTIDDEFLPGGTDKTQIQPFDTKIFEFECQSWVNDVCWNQTGTLGFAGCQNSRIYIIDYKNGTTDSINLNHSPAEMIILKDDASFYCIGFDREIYLYENEGGIWKMKKVISEEEKTEEKAAASNAVLSKIKIFGGTKAASSIISSKEKKKNIHFSLITSATIKDKKMITSDLAGFVKYWSI